MERLYKGVKKFKESYFPKEEALFKRLADGQSPDTLFFSCSDSRIDPNVITQSKPGELFIVKNIGNIVPSCSPQRKENSAAAAIEYALVFMDVTDIVVCAHSDCGAMKALYKKAEDFKESPHLKEWIDTAQPVRERVERLNNELPLKALYELTAKENVIVQLKNLKTFPVVTRALDAGKLNLHGWYYDIGTGAVHAYNEGKNTFEEIYYNEKRLDGAAAGDACGSS
jgi:carbonic anhydrase